MTARRELTAQELRLLEALAHGGSNRDVGETLGMSENAVKTTAKRVFAKLGARDRTHAVALGFHSGALKPDGPRHVCPGPLPVPQFQRDFAALLQQLADGRPLKDIRAEAARALDRANAEARRTRTGAAS